MLTKSNVHFYYQVWISFEISAQKTRHYNQWFPLKNTMQN